MKMKYIIFGASGMVGEGVLHEALIHQNTESVLVIGRRSCNVAHPKLKEILHKDFFDFSSLEEQLKGYQACFFCLGISSMGMSEEEYTQVAYDITMHAAGVLSRLNPDMTFCYVSGTGTDSTEQSRLMWARVKGKTENHLKKLPFKAVYSFRPGFIKPTKGLKNAPPILQAIGWLYPILKIIFPRHVCTLEEIGRAMIHAAETGSVKQVLENTDISKLAIHQTEH